MRLPPAAIPAALLAIAVAGGASAGPRDATLGRLSAGGPVSLVSSRPGTALLHAERMTPGDRVTGTVALTNTGDHPGNLTLSPGGLRDRPGAYGGRLSTVLRLRVEDLGGGRAPVETTLAGARTIALGRLAAGRTRAFRVTATFPDTGLPSGPGTGDNLQQGSSAQVALQWRLADAAPAAPPARPAPPAAVPAPVPVPGPGPRALLVTLRIPRQRVLGPRAISAFAQCEVACRVRFSARTDTAPRGGRRRTLQRRHVLRGERRWRTLQAGEEQRLVLRLRRKAASRLKRRLHSHGRVGITVTARMRSAAGDRTVRRRIVLRTYRRGERRAPLP